MFFFQKNRTFLIIFFASMSISCGGGSNTTNLKKDEYKLLSIEFNNFVDNSIKAKKNYVYDVEGRLTGIENIENGSLSSIITNKYDQNGNLIYSIKKSSNKSTILRKSTSTYNKSNEKVAEKIEDFEHDIFSYWIEKDGVKTNYNRSNEIISTNKFTSDAHKNKLKEIIDIDNDGIADKVITNTYNKNGKLLTRIIINQSKIIIYRESRTYDSYGNILSIMSFNPSEDTDEQMTKYKYTYDSNQNISTATIEDANNISKQTYSWGKISPIAYFKEVISIAGTGCSASSVSITGVETQSLSILFDSYDAGKDSKSGLNRSACSFSVPIKIPAGSKISKLTADWEGYVEGKGELKRKYFLAGKPYTPWKKDAYDKPDGDNFTITDNINDDSLSTKCNGEIVNLRIDSQIKTTGEQSYAAVDSADLHNDIKLLLHIESCE